MNQEHKHLQSAIESKLPPQSILLTVLEWRVFEVLAQQSRDRFVPTQRLRRSLFVELPEDLSPDQRKKKQEYRNKRLHDATKGLRDKISQLGLNGNELLFPTEITLVEANHDRWRLEAQTMVVYLKANGYEVELRVSLHARRSLLKLCQLLSQTASPSVSVDHLVQKMRLKNNENVIAKFDRLTKILLHEVDKLPELPQAFKVQLETQVHLLFRRMVVHGWYVKPLLDDVQPITIEELSAGFISHRGESEDALSSPVEKVALTRQEYQILQFFVEELAANELGFISREVLRDKLEDVNGSHTRSIMSSLRNIIIKLGKKAVPYEISHNAMFEAAQAYALTFSQLDKLEVRVNDSLDKPNVQIRYGDKEIKLTENVMILFKTIYDWYYRKNGKKRRNSITYEELANGNDSIRKRIPVYMEKLQEELAKLGLGEPEIFTYLGHGYVIDLMTLKGFHLEPRQSEYGGAIMRKQRSKMSDPT